MEHLTLVSYLSESAGELLKSAEAVEGIEKQSLLDEAAELFALSANITNRHARSVVVDMPVMQEAA
ncbi:MAG: hypothetical protein ACPGOV_06170 [Magnetovibrionaceae bacterium]